LNKTISIGFGIICYIVAFMPYYWNRLFGYSGSIWLKEGIPVLLWIICIVLLNSFRNVTLKKYWWVFVSAPICLWPILVTIVAFACWKLRGFAP